MPESDAVTFVAAFVAMLTTVTATPGTTALVESLTTPVTVPRSDCAKDNDGAATVKPPRIMNAQRRMLMAHLLTRGVTRGSDLRHAEAPLLKLQVEAHMLHENEDG